MPAAMFAFYFGIALLLTAQHPIGAAWAAMLVGSYLVMRPR